MVFIDLIRVTLVSAEKTEFSVNPWGEIRLCTALPWITALILRRVALALDVAFKNQCCV